jgi:excisionase family DNA binding protein
MHSVSEAAAKLGLTDRHVRFLLRRGELSGRKLGHDWVVLSLDYARKRKPKGSGKSEAAPDRLRQKPDEVWTEGSF